MQEAEPNGRGQSDPGDATNLLTRVGQGDTEASSQLLSLLYEQLRAIAGGQFRGQRVDHTLQPTALVHEAYLKLIRAGGDWKDRAHFCAVAATAMRQVLRDHARAKQAAKRSAQRVDVTLEAVARADGAGAFELIALNEALAKLQALNERYARLVELRFFGGLTVEDMVPILKVSEQTLYKEWRRAKAWLSRELCMGSEGMT